MGVADALGLGELPAEDASEEERLPGEHHHWFAGQFVAVRDFEQPDELPETSELLVVEVDVLAGQVVLVPPASGQHCFVHEVFARQHLLRVDGRVNYWLRHAQTFRRGWSLAYGLWPLA